MSPLTFHFPAFFVHVVPFHTACQYPNNNHQTPETEIIEVQTEQMLAASSIGIGNPIDNASVAESDEYDFFIEDEEF